MVEGMNLDELGSGRRARGGARPQEASHLPASITKGFRRGVAEAPGGSQNENPTAHLLLPPAAWRLGKGLVRDFQSDAGFSIEKRFRRRQLQVR
jgi:hypothetical protein